MNVGSPSRMISHTDELSSVSIKNKISSFDPLSTRKVLYLIGKMKDSTSGNDEICSSWRGVCPPAADSNAHITTQDKFIE